ncbi:MAG: hypothetical protein ACRENE_10140 [Polyangiaceae bacterium]
MGAERLQHEQGEGALPSEPESAPRLGSGTIRSQRARPQLEADRLDYRLISPRGPGDPALLAAYATWSEGWSATFRELDGMAELRSDEFTRLDQVGVLLYEGRCVSVTGLRWLDMSLPMSIQDSYFRAWPKDALGAIGAGLLGVSCNTIIAPAWRGGLVHASEGDPLLLKNLTLRMSLRQFLDTPAQTFVGVARNDRGMHDTAGELGCRRMGSIVLHGIESDICTWTRSDVINLGPVVEGLWDKWKNGEG